MKRLLARRSILGLLGAVTATAVGAVAVGRRNLFAEAAGTRSSIQTPTSGPAVAPATATPPPGAIIAGPAEEITFSGNVDRALGPAQFIGSDKQFKGITVDLSNTPAAKI